MNYKKLICTVFIVNLGMAIATGCSQSEVSTSAISQITRPDDWGDITHSDSADPDYRVVFPQDKVNQIKIIISLDNWEAMQANMAELFGNQVKREQGTQQPANGGIRPNVIGGGGGDMTPVNPMWIPATIEFNDLTWTNVGVRYKGNSSLRSGWNSGGLKLPLKLDFDEFEDECPEISNQRFYGFKQLTLSNAFNDGTYMHDAIVADLLEDSGLPAAETAYYEVIMDYNDGEVNLGLYVMIEVIDDTVIDRFFSDDSGNIYEADGAGASLASGTFNRIKSSFQKENNEQEADWSDIEELYKVLHSYERISNPEKWRENLESIFDVDTFLKWLGISAITLNWDNYGSMTHNFYLYHDPVTDRLIWISWDHNEVFGSSGKLGINAPRAGMNRVVTFDKAEVRENWPLIRYLLDDPVYRAHYLDYLEETINEVFSPEELEKKCLELSKLIKPYVTLGIRTTNFDSAVQQLIARIYERYEATVSFLGQ